MGDMDIQEKKTRELVLARIDAFLKANGMSEREFGLQAVNSHKFVNRLRKGYGVTLTSIEKAEAIMDRYLAADTDGVANEQADQTAEQAT